MENIAKPSPPFTTKFLNYSDCINYIEKKYNIKTSDYAGKYLYKQKAKEAADKICGDTSWYFTKPIDFTEIQKQAYHEFNEALKHSPPDLDFWDKYCDDIK